ncbi:leucine-rich repeat domain-containing protein [Treponema sp. R80B11-R83G3]
MRLTKKLFGIAAIIAVIGFFALPLIGCNDTDPIDHSTFTSIDGFATWLAAQPDNTAATPYVVKLNVSSLGAPWPYDGNIRNLLKNNPTKYVSLDLSGSTFTSIRDSDFRSCDSLTSVTIPSSVTSIGEWAFNQCWNLTSVTIPDSVNSIGDVAFSNCTRLASVTIPDSVNSIGDGAFASCTSLTSVNIPSVKRIGQYAFSNCTSLTDLTINWNDSLGKNAFKGCTSLTSVTLYNTTWWEDENSHGASVYEYFGYLFGASNIESQNSSIPESLKTVIINNKIGSRFFYGCTSLTSVTVSSSIGGDAFAGCTNLASVTIGNYCNAIRDGAFYGCNSLTSVTIPASVTSIGGSAFFYCTSLTSVTFQGTITKRTGDTINFGSNYHSPFSGNLEAKFYETNSTNGTPGNGL